MSWNIQLRLNNLQQQINNIANEGLINPLEEILDANGYTLTNLNILDGASNALQINTNNVNGISTNADLSVGGDISCNVLNYSSLNPPISASGTSFVPYNSQATETSSGNFVLVQGVNPLTGFITKTPILNPSATAEINFSAVNGNNGFAFGFSSVNTNYPNGGFKTIEYGVYWYPPEQSIRQITNGNTTSNFIPFTNLGNVNLTLKCLGSSIKVFVNGLEQTELEQVLPSDYFYFCVGCNQGVGVICNVNNIFVEQNNYETLNEVLSNGNDGGGLDIVGINQLTCSQLNYTSLNPPIEVGSNTLSEVLTNGNNANNLSITGLNDLNTQTITCNSTLSAKGYLQIGNAVGGLSNLQFLYGDGQPSGDNYALVGYNNSMLLQQYKNNALYYNPISVIDRQQIELKTLNLVYNPSQNAGDTANSFILDSLTNTPMYKQVFTSVGGVVNNLNLSYKVLFSADIYTKNVGNTTYGVNFGEILFPNMNLAFSIVGGGNFIAGTIATLYLSSTGTGNYNPQLANSLIIPMTANTPNNTFNSTIPILMYCQSPTQFNKVYLMIAFNKIPPIPATAYSCSMTNTNMIVSGYVSQNQNGSITFGS